MDAMVGPLLSNCIKAAFHKCTDDPAMAKVCDYYRGVKRIVEDLKRYGWNKNIFLQLRLIQDIGTRFGTVLLVTERFLKSAVEVWTIIQSHNPTIALVILKLCRVLKI